MRLTTSKTSCGGLLCAAAFSSLSGGSTAFTTPSSSSIHLKARPPYLAHTHSSTNHPMLTQTLAHQHSRLFFSQRDDNDWQTFKKAGGNLIKKGVGKIKSLVPFGKSEEQKRAEIMKRERKEEITGGINSMLRDMPLPIRMMGRMVSPLLARAAEEIAEQTKEAQEMLEEARMRLVNDPILADKLGEPLQVGQPFSQSSSTTVINGQSSARVQAMFEVAGPRGGGIATMESNNGEIISLAVNVNGRNISVGSSRGGNAYSKSSSSSKKGGNIIEAEIIDKK